jgi:hypothetical protein
MADDDIPPFLRRLDRSIGPPRPAAPPKIDIAKAFRIFTRLIRRG